MVRKERREGGVGKEEDEHGKEGTEGRVRDPGGGAYEEAEDDEEGMTGGVDVPSEMDETGVGSEGGTRVWGATGPRPGCE